MGLPVLSQAVQQMLLIVGQWGWRVGDGSGHGFFDVGIHGRGEGNLAQTVAHG
jgi:hypothetical protein